jgi:glycosyltransferase involved in cell wall biosynthesis
MASDPDVAVVIGAYSRGAYVLHAVRSVLGQTVARDRIEILVTKNFLEPPLDATLSEHGVGSVFDTTERIGTWLLAAVRATRAPIVTLLDDDDLYAPERLARILEVFREHPEVGYYRNRIEMLDTGGRPVPRSQWPPRATDAYFDEQGPLVIPPDRKAHLVDLLFRRTRVSFNSSTMAFRRELLDGRRGEHFAATRLPDSSLLLNAVVSPFGLFFDDRRLTGHRVHPTNVTRNTGWLTWATESNWAFALEAREFGRPELAEFYERTAIHFDRQRRSEELVDRMAAGAPRREVAGRAAEYARFLVHHSQERTWTRDVWGTEAYAATYLLSPSLVRRVQRSRSVRPAAAVSLPAE